MAPEPGEITRLLHAWQAGDRAALDDLWPLIYQELKQLARGVLRRQGRGAQDQATSLIHKTYLRLLGADVEVEDRRHFFAIAARAMRFVLADEARRQLSQKRGRREVFAVDHVSLEVADPVDRRPEEVLAVHQALSKLATLRPRHEKLVELRYFAGLSVAETAEILEVTPRTLARDWRSVRVWLRSELKATA